MTDTTNKIVQLEDGTTINLDSLNAVENLIKIDELNILPGIDALHYFHETLPGYQELFTFIEASVTEALRKATTEGMRMKDMEVRLDTPTIPLYYTGNNEGFRWFIDDDNLFKIGFKHPHKNTNLHDIRVQLTAHAIYSIGIEQARQMVKQMLSAYITEQTHITRIDVNCFIAADLSHLDKNMFSSKKQSYRQYVKEYGNAYENETIYIGKKPFMLRIYNKMLELKRSKKADLMYEYFRKNGLKLSVDSDIYNIEFQMHRDFLKQYEIYSVDEAIKNAERLFKEGLKHIRLIDLNTISHSDLIHRKKYNADTHILWNYLEKHYCIDQFKQSSLPLTKIKRVQEDTLLDNLFDETVSLIKRARKRNIKLKEDFFHEAMEQVELLYQSYKKQKQQQRRIDTALIESQTINRLKRVYSMMGKEFDEKRYIERKIPAYRF